MVITVILAINIYCVKKTEPVLFLQYLWFHVTNFNSFFIMLLLNQFSGVWSCRLPRGSNKRTVTFEFTHYVVRP